VRKKVDAAVISALEQGHNVQLVRRDNRQGFKAGAMVDGMARVADQGFEYVAIFDADFEPPEDFFYQTVIHMMRDDNLAFVQTRWTFTNCNSLLTWAQKVGLEFHFAVEQRARSFLGQFFNFNGTAGVWRIKAIHDAGGWESDTGERPAPCARPPPPPPPPLPARRRLRGLQRPRLPPRAPTRPAASGPSQPGCAIQHSCSLPPSPRRPRQRALAADLAPFPQTPPNSPQSWRTWTSPCASTCAAGAPSTSTTCAAPTSCPPPCPPTRRSSSAGCQGPCRCARALATSLARRQGAARSGAGAHAAA
jgi:hypothetical protein